MPAEEVPPCTDSLHWLTPLTLHDERARLKSQSPTRKRDGDWLVSPTPAIHDLLGTLDDAVNEFLHRGDVVYHTHSK